MERERNEDILCRKQITFDLNQKALAQNYPKPRVSLDPLYYKKAYKDIKRFMLKNGFEWVQYSVYVSKEKLTNMDIRGLSANLATLYPWTAYCNKGILVTDIGRQYDVSDILLDVVEKENNMVNQPAQKAVKETKLPSLQDQILHATEKAEAMSTNPQNIKMKSSNRFDFDL